VARLADQFLAQPEETLSCDVVGTGDAVGTRIKGGREMLRPGQPKPVSLSLLLCDREPAAKQVPVRHCGSSPLRNGRTIGKTPKYVSVCPSARKDSRDVFKGGFV